MIDLEKMSKEHATLFPNATAESQFVKLEEEINELLEAETTEQELKEKADIQIVCGGLYRWFPRVAEVISRNYFDSLGIEAEVNRKWQVNLGRKWEWNGKTYKHVGKDGNE